MDYFYDISALLKKVKILILGSYIPQNFKLLEALKIFLIKKGFENTKLGRDIIEVPSGTIFDANLAYIYEKVKEAMLESDFNIFVFFSPIDQTKISYSNINESTSVELTSLVESTTDNKINSRLIIFFPNGYYSAMVQGLTISKKLFIFEYNNSYQIFMKAYTFVKQNFNLIKH